MVVLFLVSRELSYWSSEWLYQFTFQPTIQEGSLFFTPSPTLIVCRLFDDGHCDLFFCFFVGFFCHLMWRADSLEKTLMLGKTEAGGKGDDRGWDGWMASRTWWAWVWASSRSWWGTGKPGVLQSMGLQRVRHNWVTELNRSDCDLCEVILHCGFDLHFSVEHLLMCLIVFWWSMCLSVEISV